MPFHNRITDRGLAADIRPMLALRAFRQCQPRCRYYATAATLRPVPILSDASVETFRKQAFEPATPALLPRRTFKELPAVKKWFTRSRDGKDSIQLNTSYLSRYGSCVVPLEILNNEQFTRIDQSLSFFLESVNAASSTYRIHHKNRYFSSYTPNARALKRTAEANDFFSASTLTVPTARIYLAQASLGDLPTALRNDVPTPEIVLKAGKGDVYDTSIWLGQAPTYTPLHRDPNPNLFVQLAGKKSVRLFRPRAGQAIFAKVQENIGASSSATVRGEEMMQGAEKKLLEHEVWSNESESLEHAWEAELGSGDGLFIPKGWWHSIKGVGTGMTGSVNWWFR